MTWSTRSVALPGKQLVEARSILELADLAGNAVQRDTSAKALVVIGNDGRPTGDPLGVRFARKPSFQVPKDGRRALRKRSFEPGWHPM